MIASADTRRGTDAGAVAWQVQRIVDSTGALELRQIPKRMLVIGGGIIGLKMATAYSTLGARIDVVEMLYGLMQGADRDAVKV